MKNKKLIKIMPLIVLTLLAISGGFSATVFAAETVSTSSSFEIRHVRGALKNAPITKRRGGLVGTVSAINGSMLSVKDGKGVIFAVDASSAKLFKDFASTTIALGDIKIDDRVLVRGTTVGTSVKAEVIIDGKFTQPGVGMGHGMMMGRGMKAGFGVRGVVSTISGSTLTLNATNSTVYTVDASGATIFKGSPKAISTLAEIKSGDSVMVIGTTTGTTIIATKIIDGLPSVVKKAKKEGSR